MTEEQIAAAEEEIEDAIARFRFAQFRGEPHRNVDIAAILRKHNRAVVTDHARAAAREFIGSNGIRIDRERVDSLAAIIARHMAESERELLDGLRAIRCLGGNLPNERLIGGTGPNDAMQRGLMYCECRRIARDLLAKRGMA